MSLRANMPQVPAHVTLIKAWFNETLPGFLAAHPGKVSLCTSIAIFRRSSFLRRSETG
jgi:hypothetical protein